MIYLLYGEDSLSLEEHLTSFKQAVGPAELYDVNVTVLDGTQVGYQELVATCSAVPFLADKRLVIVKGLLSQFETRAPRAHRLAVERAALHHNPNAAAQKTGVAAPTFQNR